MNYIINFFLILSLLIGFSFSQNPKKIKKDKPPIVKSDNDRIFTKEWDKKNKTIKDPELLKLLEVLKQDFSEEKKVLKKEFKQKTENLRNKYIQKRKDIVMKYREEKNKANNK